MTNNVSNRLKREARLNQQPPRAVEYEIIDPHFKPDLRGEFAGIRVTQRNGKYYVLMRPAQAEFYLLHQTIREYVPVPVPDAIAPSPVVEPVPLLEEPADAPSEKSGKRKG